MPKYRKDVPLQTAHHVLCVPGMASRSPSRVPRACHGFERRLLRDKQGKLRLPLLIRRIYAGLHLVPGLVTRSTRLLKVDLRVGTKEQHLLAPADVIAPAPGALPAGCDKDEQRVAVKNLVRALTGDQVRQLLVGEPTSHLAESAESGGVFRHLSGPSVRRKVPR